MCGAVAAACGDARRPVPSHTHRCQRAQGHRQQHAIERQQTPCVRRRVETRVDRCPAIPIAVMWATTYRITVSWDDIRSFKLLLGATSGGDG